MSKWLLENLHHESFFTLRYLKFQGKINSSPLVVVFTRPQSKPNLIQCNSRLRMSLTINMFILRSFTNMNDFFVVYPLKKYNLVRFSHHVYCTHWRNGSFEIGQLNLKMALPCSDAIQNTPLYACGARSCWRGHPMGAMRSKGRIP